VNTALVFQCQPTTGGLMKLGVSPSFSQYRPKAESLHYEVALKIFDCRVVFHKAIKSITISLIHLIDWSISTSLSIKFQSYRDHQLTFEFSISTFIVRLLRIQLFKYSIFSIFLSPTCILSHEIVRRAPENIRSDSAFIAGIDRISIVSCDGFGQRFLCDFESHQESGELSISIVFLAM
jgi:hypothetical protein